MDAHAPTALRSSHSGGGRKGQREAVRGCRYLQYPDCSCLQYPQQQKQYPYLRVLEQLQDLRLGLDAVLIAGGQPHKVAQVVLQGGRRGGKEGCARMEGVDEMGGQGR